MNSCDRRFMALALEQAEEAARAGEVPVGAVAVVGGKAVVSARNRVEERRSATAHAELELLHKLELLRGAGLPEKPERVEFRTARSDSWALCYPVDGGMIQIVLRRVDDGSFRFKSAYR